MNAEEIKKRLRSKNVNFNTTQQETEKKEIKKTPEPVLYHEPSESENERYDHTNIFSPDESEEIEPESEIWEAPEHLEKIGNVEPKEFIKMLGLRDEEYDWRRETRKGRKSRENFSKYIITVI
jgi:hypothetical protein